MDYEIHCDVKFGPVDLVDVGRLADECSVKWWNQPLCRVNDCIMRTAVLMVEAATVVPTGD